MKTFYGAWTFYRKLIVPVLLTSFLTGFLVYLSAGSITGAINFTGLSYLFYTPVFQYFIYEVRSPHEYYFYYNLGMSKACLWMACAAISLLICLIIIIL